MSPSSYGSATHDLNNAETNEVLYLRQSMVMAICSRCCQTSTVVENVKQLQVEVNREHLSICKQYATRYFHHPCVCRPRKARMRRVNAFGRVCLSRSGSSFCKPWSRNFISGVRRYIFRIRRHFEGECVGTPFPL